MADSRITIEVKVKSAPERIPVALSMSDWIDIQVALSCAKRREQESLEMWKRLGAKLKKDGSPRHPSASRSVKCSQQQIDNMERIINEITSQVMPGIETGTEN